MLVRFVLMTSIVIISLEKDGCNGRRHCTSHGWGGTNVFAGTWVPTDLFLGWNKEQNPSAQVQAQAVFQAPLQPRAGKRRQAAGGGKKGGRRKAEGGSGSGSDRHPLPFLRIQRWRVQFRFPICSKMGKSEGECGSVCREGGGDGRR
ncbi:hypothetical protein B0T10DRAFT_474245 [Thelonectria olida]|uniref:Secreted protein n=1 Tax=Thelonectria olida TaxID=1576542 RepID=A0A9P9AVL8_9HYPO|nr:hypothetical protein B0T10DRAFT_474245 [Thelonectria olida]